MNLIDHSCVALRYFRPPFHALVNYHMERDGMPLNDAVGVNCEGGETTEIQGAGARYMG